MLQLHVASTALAWLYTSCSQAWMNCPASAFNSWHQAAYEVVETIHFERGRVWCDTASKALAT
jgi:hypothetical protein